MANFPAGGYMSTHEFLMILRQVILLLDDFSGHSVPGGLRGSNSKATFLSRLKKNSKGAEKNSSRTPKQAAAARKLRIIQAAAQTYEEPSAGNCFPIYFVTDVVGSRYPEYVRSLLKACPDYKGRRWLANTFHVRGMGNWPRSC